jgi:hypothetical protein
MGASVVTSHTENVALCDRARKIALRLAPLPEGPAVNGFRRRAEFIARCRQTDRHNRVYRDVFRRLHEKANIDLSLTETVSDPMLGRKAA